MNVVDMQLKRTTLDGYPAWRWMMPSGIPLYFMQTIDGSGWVARRGGNAISTPAFNTLQSLKAHIAIFFEDQSDGQ